jgi:hypothetical protein
VPAYNILNWYWITKLNGLQVWSSSRQSWVPTTDATYQNWISGGNKPTTVTTVADIASVMTGQWIPVASAGGLQVVCSGNSALSGTYGLDPISLFNITGVSAGIAAGKALPSGTSTFNYRDITGTAHAFTAPAFTAFAAAIEAYVYQFQEAIVELVLGNTATIPTQPVTFASA